MLTYLKKCLLILLVVILSVPVCFVAVGADTLPFQVRDLSRYILEDSSYFSGAKPNWTVDKMLTDFVSGDSYEVYNGENPVNSSSETVKTGLTLKNETRDSVCTIVLKGDLNGDGRISTIDYMKIKTYISGNSTLSGASLNAADFDGNGEIKASDYMLVKGYFTGEDVYKKTPDIEISYVNFEQPKNIILMIGDGMGPTHIEVAREKTGGNLNGKFYLDYLPNNGYEKTYSLNGLTDSAAAGTALATGYKTFNGVIGLDRNGNEIQNIRELCASLGMKTGVITTKNGNDATPAAFSAHSTSRSNSAEIAMDQLLDLPDILLGATDNGYSTAMGDATVSAKYKTYDVTRCYSHSVLYKAKTEKIFGTFTALQEVDLPKVTEKALSHLETQDTQDKGFFIMIEGGKIDNYSHNNDLDGMIKEMDEFDEAIGVAMDYVYNNPDTILIVTSDHETGGLQADGSFTTGGHTNADCRVMALGYGTEVFDGKMVNNTDIPKFIAKTLGINNFGDQNIGYMETPTEVTYYSSDNSLVHTITRPSVDVRISQGGYTDGKYYYQAFIQKDTASNEENNVVQIVKYDMETGKKVLTSENLKLNHANDITMNTKTNQLIVCNNNPNRTKITFLDPETLTITGTKDIGRKIFSIDYNESRDCYVVGISGGQTFAVLDSNFNKIAGPYEPTFMSEGCTTQGVGCDDNYIYFVFYSPNVVTVYDWNGKFVRLITLDDIDPAAMEPENISSVDGELYVGCGLGAGLQVYNVTNITKKTIEVYLPK